MYLKRFSLLILVDQTILFEFIPHLRSGGAGQSGRNLRARKRVQESSELNANVRETFQLIVAMRGIVARARMKLRKTVHFKCHRDA
jgi:hypothetical protein